MSTRLTYFSAIKFLSTYIRDYKKHFFMFYIGWLFDSIMTIMMPVLFGIMIDEIVYYQNLSTFIKIAFVFLICILFSGGLYFLIYAQHAYLMNMFVFSIRKDVFGHLQKCDAQYLSNAETGDIITTTQFYPEQCMHFVIRNIIHAINGIIMIILYGMYLIMIDWRIGLIGFLNAFISIFITTKFEGRIRSLGDDERNTYGKYISWMYEIITALRDIRILGAREKVDEDFHKHQHTLFRIGIKSGITSMTAENVLAFVKLTVRLLIYAISAYLAVGGDVTLGTITVIFSFYEKLSDNIRSTSMKYLDAQNRISYIQKIYDFLHTPTEHGGKSCLEVKHGEIKFRNITFAYKDKDVLLKNISLQIKPGEHLALVGKSGCGKTTLAYLLIGFYQMQAGNIEIDGQNLADCSLASIRQKIGLVQQDVLVFDGTLSQNLLMGNLRATENEILEACRAAGLSEFVDSLQDGLDTMIGSQGVGLSGGQKQRIAIARIYLKNPSIIIFDEATSALDRETEDAIHQAWKELLKGKTAIMIAHRQSSAMLCDRIALMEDGVIAETGIPDEMAEASEKFRTLFAIKDENI